MVLEQNYIGRKNRVGGVSKRYRPFEYLHFRADRGICQPGFQEEGGGGRQRTGTECENYQCPNHNAGETSLRYDYDDYDRGALLQRSRSPPKPG